MRKFLILVAASISLNAPGQGIFHGQILSVADSTPISHFSIRVNNKKIITTDSVGFFSVTTSKKKIRLTAIFGLHYFDTTLTIKNNSNGIRLYTAGIYDSALAAYDIQFGKLILFCGVAFAPMASTRWDKDFEKKFNLQYFIVGDFLPSSVPQMESYNKVIADYLDKLFGQEWRLQLRRDVLGIPKKAGN